MNNTNNDQNMIHQINVQNSNEKMSAVAFFIFVAIAVVFGVIIGVLPKKFVSNKTGSSSTSTAKEKSAGIVDKSTFKDSASGVLREGGIDGEGNYHLERTGGDSQNVYLTSTTVDLSLYVGKKVKVWGQTFSGEKAGWLMDVGLVETQ